MYPGGPSSDTGGLGTCEAAVLYIEIYRLQLFWNRSPGFQKYRLHIYIYFDVVFLWRQDWIFIASVWFSNCLFVLQII